MKILLLFIALVGLIPRCAHLFNSNYYILGVDSYLFHHLAQYPQNPLVAVKGYPWHSGITYPVYVISRIVGIEAASCVVPLILYLAIFILLYIFVSRYWGKLTAIATVITWALIPHSGIITATGYLDRDALSIMLYLLALVVILAWPHTLWKHMIGLVIVVVMAITQWAQWHLAGGLIVMSIPVVVIGYRIMVAMNMKLSIISLTLIGGIVYGFTRIAILVMGINTEDIGEMQSIRLADVFLYFGWSVPLVILGVYAVIKKPDHKLAVIVIMLIVSIASAAVVSRVLLFAVPTACILAGVGANFALSKYQEIGGYDTLKTHVARLVIGMLIVTIIAVSSWATITLQGNHRMAPDSDWQKALRYINSDTPHDAKVACLTNYNYWVVDLSNRVPLTKAAFRGHIDHIIELYMAKDPMEFIDVMQQIECDYFICSTWEYDNKYVIERMATISGLYQDLNYNESVVYETLHGQYSELPVAYRNDTVIIIGSIARDCPGHQTSPAERFEPAPR